MGGEFPTLQTPLVVENEALLDVGTCENHPLFHSSSNPFSIRGGSIPRMSKSFIILLNVAHVATSLLREWKPQISPTISLRQMGQVFMAASFVRF